MALLSFYEQLTFAVQENFPCKVELLKKKVKRSSDVTSYTICSAKLRGQYFNTTISSSIDHSIGWA